eukprot:CAMPEP_0168597188 /NCGR_PEP_ID=MMETSP0420-20121227/10496_1 /TAXON_ID=498008 /ORGANISM="Pessonella sp." /LENGTH=44 /DNA_ID= /DNA_START= /DNA_END= /DNA_ORIENTATION=
MPITIAATLSIDDEDLSLEDSLSIAGAAATLVVLVLLVDVVDVE